MDKTIDTGDIRIFKEPDVAKYLPRIRRRVENEDFYKEVAENSGDVFTVALWDEVIGLVYMDDDTEGFLYVFIFPEHRRRGYGFAAARAAEGLMKTTQPKSILTGYPADDEAALLLCRRRERLLGRMHDLRALERDVLPRDDDVVPPLEGLAAGEILHRAPADEHGRAVGHRPEMRPVGLEHHGLRAVCADAPVGVDGDDRFELHVRHLTPRPGSCA